MEKQRMLFEAVFKCLPSDPGTSGWLEEVAAAHPYFSVAQFFLLQQTDAASAAYPQQARKTSVLFNNPGWLHFQLQKNQHSAEASPAAALTGAISPALSEKADEAPAAISDREALASPAPAVLPDTEVPALTPTAEPVLPESPATPAVSVETAAEPAEEAATAPAEPAPALQIPVPDPLPAPPADAPLFEPLHTSDYFASVGIKLSEEEKTSDRLGRQMKSFTDWLKTMKRLHAGQLAQTTEPAAVETAAAESHIRHLAEQSNQEDEVLTEAMAGVLLQQGRKDKAVEILEKLSLLNPAKSAYFAAKIHQIKGD